MRKDYQFQIGDLVYMEYDNKLNRGKFDPIREGPFKIICQISSTFYEVASNHRRQVSNYVHSSKLTPYAPVRCKSACSLRYLYLECYYVLCFMTFLSIIINVIITLSIMKELYIQIDVITCNFISFSR